MFSALAGTLLAGTFGHSSRALAGGMIAIVFGSGVAFTLATTLGTVIAVAESDSRAEAVAGLFLAGYIGLSIPVIALGVALQELSPKVALLGFASLAAAGLVVASRPLLGRARPARLAFDRA